MANEAARPYYDRQPGDICIQIEIFDAEAEHTEKLGSRHYFLVHLRERFFELLQKSDLLKLKAYFEKRSVLKDCSIESFLEGNLCIVCPSSVAALHRLQKDYESKRLERIFTECFVTPIAMKKLDVTSMKITVHLWKEELRQVESEWRDGTVPQKYDMNLNAKSRQMLKKLRQLQVKQLQQADSGAGPRLRDAEAKFEQNFSSLINYLKLLRSNSMRPVETLHELRQQFEAERGSIHSPDEQLLLQYFATLQEAARVAQQLQLSIAPLWQQIRVGGENTEQVQLKQAVLSLVEQIKEAVREDRPLTQRHEAYVNRISGSERIVYAGFVSLLPVVVRLVLDLDETIDEYFSCGSVVFKQAELGDS